MFLCRLVFKRQIIAAVASFGFGSFKTTSFRSNCVPCDNPNKDDDEDWKYKENLPFHDDEDSDNQPTKRRSLELPLLLRKPKGTFGRKHVNKRALKYDGANVQCLNVCKYEKKKKMGGFSILYPKKLAF
jgi:hypothetical protein